ncbi:MAG: sulfotransferase [Alphaproteobacteria bacterium]
MSKNKSKAPPVWFHIGLPKCASTFLQAQVFDRHPDIDFLGVLRLTGHTVDSIAIQKRYPAYDFLRYLKQTEELVYDREALMQRLARKPGEAPGVAVISDEDLVFPDKVDRLIKAQRLAGAFPEAQIMVVLRNQLDWLESFYLFELRKSQRFYTMQAWLERNWKDIEKSNFRVMRYHELLGAYRDIFGAARLHVLFYEDLKADAQGFIGAVCKPLGVDPARLPPDASGRKENVRMPQMMFAVARRFPALYSARVLLPTGLKARIRDNLTRRARPSKAVLTPEWRERIEAFCAPGNRQLVETMGLPLDKKGYPV